MIDGLKALLLDLDGTLIDVKMDKFIPSYFRLLSEFLKEIVPPKILVSRLMKVSKVVENNDGSKTNEEAYAEEFFPLDGHTQEELEPLFDEFYQKEFPKLKIYTHELPEAKKVVQKAFDKSYDVIIATTPLLPRIAITKRLQWAGVADFPYTLITSYENCTATKPNLLYYEEILTKLNQSAINCLMVGDEDKDMVARKLGIKTFFIENSTYKLNEDTPEPDYRGNLKDLLNLI
ncbi:MAG: HAD family hydrolase [Candidatus Lokiarchaeota archaeon]